jgi:hypothetical protein
LGTSGHGIGIPGVDIEPGDHVCALFEGEAQRDEILFSFLRAGLEDGDKCVVVLDHDDPAEVLERFADKDEIARWQASSALVVCGSPSELPVAGPLDVPEMLANWDDAIAATEESSRFDFVRVTGDATWWSTQADGDTLVRYESALTGYIPERLAVMCLYDVERVERATLINAVRTHPRLLAGSVVIENPHYLQPDELNLARAIPVLPGNEIEVSIRQLARLTRLDPDQPVVEFECGVCGTLLATTVPTPDHPTVLVMCPRCGSTWDHRTDGVLRRRS